METVALSDLWLAILLGAVAIFFLSFVCWMVLPHHFKDFRTVPNEDGLMEFLRKSGAGRGQYRFPNPSAMADWKNEAFQAKWKVGPTGFLTIHPMDNMGGAMAKSFLFNVAITLAVAYLATIGLSAGADGTTVFRFVATATWMASAWANVWGWIWMGRDGGQTFRDLLDSLVYGLAVGAIFVWQWPGAAA